MKPCLRTARVSRAAILISAPGDNLKRFTFALIIRAWKRECTGVRLCVAEKRDLLQRNALLMTDVKYVFVDVAYFLLWRLTDTDKV